MIMHMGIVRSVKLYCHFEDAHVIMENMPFPCVLAERHHFEPCESACFFSSCSLVSSLSAWHKVIAMCIACVLLKSFMELTKGSTLLYMSFRCSLCKYLLHKYDANIYYATCLCFVPLVNICRISFLEITNFFLSLQDRLFIYSTQLALREVI